jgi:hypothetical protein
LLPFGYKIGVDRKIEVDPEKAIIVKRVFERICKGEPPYCVARRMISEVHNTYHGK